MLIDEAGHLTARVVQGERKVVSRRVAILKLQDMAREKVPEGVPLVDELIDERRAEARKEADESALWLVPPRYSR